MARRKKGGMARCPGEAEGVACAHGEITVPFRIVWGAVEVPLNARRELVRWERGDYEPWARSVLLLPLGYVWASDRILWHASSSFRLVGSRRLFVVVVSRAVRWTAGEDPGRL